MKSINSILISLTILITGIIVSFSQVAITSDGSDPDSSAMLDVRSTSKGLLVPRMTTSDRTAISSPAPGLLVYDTDSESFWYKYSGGWKELGSAEGSTTTGSGLVGSIVPYAGTTAPTGYLICDGSSVDKNTYADLFNAIGTVWGGDGLPNFNLPDLRGRFPRGKDSGAGNDPDAATRTNITGANTLGDVVGSYQGDDFKSHNHRALLQAGGADATGTIKGGANSPGGHTDTQIVHTGGSETRPKNASVLYIIKH